MAIVVCMRCSGMRGFGYQKRLYADLWWRNSLSNAACEGFFGRLKTEMYYGRKWSGITSEKFMQHVDTYIRWYNERRIKLSLGAVSPKMYRQQCGLA